ncbi:MAG: glycosyltransferase [Candidatus Wallbacteria bacterium]|nr:glycosyltransferase [Candidatus Wallbacteria bacterium]
MKNIVYFDFIRFPTEKAHGYQIARTCEALSAHGNVQIVLPGRRNGITQSPDEYYGLTKPLDVTFLRFPDFLVFSRFFSGRTLTAVLYIGRLAFLLQFAVEFFHLRKKVTVYSRNFLAALLARCGYSVVLEEHEPPINGWRAFLYERLLSIVSGVVCISRGVDLRIRELCPGVLTAVVPDATDPADYSAGRQECRERLGLPQDAFIAGYTGSLAIPWKGVRTLLQAADQAPEIMFLIVGGTAEEMLKFGRALPENVRYISRRPQKEIPALQAACDVLVIPNLFTDANSCRFTSPLKLFEYFASGVPVVASDVPSLRDIAGDAALYFRPGDAEDLVKCLRKLRAGKLPNMELAQRIAEENTWENRGRRIAEKINEWE